jgi:hypothetical protein
MDDAGPGQSRAFCFILCIYKKKNLNKIMTTKASIIINFYGLNTLTTAKKNECLKQLIAIKEHLIFSSLFACHCFK